MDFSLLNTKNIIYSISLSKYPDINSVKNFIREKSINAIYITHTKIDSNSIDFASTLKQNLPNLDIIITISAKYYQNIQETIEFIKKAQQKNLNRFLIVSGFPKNQMEDFSKNTYDKI